MKIMTSVEERLKLKRGQVDTWSIREKLCLASSVVRSGNQNWMSVSRSLKGFGGEPGRPADWFSQKSCAVQYDNLLTQIETPKRKKRGADGTKSEVPDLTPAEVIVKQLTIERIEELRKIMAEVRAVYFREKEELFLVENGQADDRLEEMLCQIQEEKKQKELEQEEHQRWLRQREERKQEMEMAWRPHAAQQHYRGPATQSSRRPSSHSEMGSEAENESPSSSDQPLPSEDVTETKPAPTPSSPLLTSLLKSPSPVTGTQSSSILHSAITSQRGASPTITSLLNSSPAVPSATSPIPSSPNRKTLVSSTLSGHDDVPKAQPLSASSSPTLSMLLERLPSTPVKLTEPPYSSPKTPLSTASPSAATKTVNPVVPVGGLLNECAIGYPHNVGDCQSPKEYLISMDEAEDIAVGSVEKIHNVPENMSAIAIFDVPSLVAPIVVPLQENVIIDALPAQANDITQEVVVATKSNVTMSEVNTGNDLDHMKKETISIPNVENMGIVLSVETEIIMPGAESKATLETPVLQQLSSSDLEYVVDPSIDTDLQEFSPGELMDEIAGYIDVSSEDVETSVSNMLESVESDNAAEPVADALNSDQISSNKETHVEELKGESESAFVIVQAPSAQQSPQQTSAASIISSPRSAGRMSKGNIVARKIIMEDEQLSNCESELIEEDDNKLEGAENFLSREDLESASVVFVQDNGEVAKLSETVEAAGIMTDFQNVVLVPHDNDIIRKENFINESLHSIVQDISDSDLVVKEDTCAIPGKDGDDIDIKSSVKTPRKSNEKKESFNDSNTVKKIDDHAKIDMETPSGKLILQSESLINNKDPPQSEEQRNIELNTVSNNIKKIEIPQKDESENKVELLSPKEGPRRQKSLSLTKKDKVPAEVARESKKDVAASKETPVEEALQREDKKDSDQQEENQGSQRDAVECLQVQDEVVQPIENEGRVLQIKEEKVGRAETPSTEDDNTRDAEQPQTYRGRRGRYGRDSVANSDSVPNSPIPSNMSLDDEKDHRAWKKSIMLVYNRIAAHKNASIFLRPITDDKAPGYSSMVYRPLDLQTIKKNVENGIIRTTEDFQRDVLIMFNNAIMYNKSKTPIHDMAREMQEEGVAHLQEFMNVQKVGKDSGSEGSLLPSRRGTRTAEKRDQDSEGTRRTVSDKLNSSKTGLLGKRKRSFPDEKITPKRRKDSD